MDKFEKIYAHKNYDAGANKKQPKGHPIGNSSKPITSPPSKGINKMTKQSKREVANTGPSDRGSKLVERTNCDENASQPQGQSIGAGGAPNPKMHHGGSPHVFHFPQASGASTFRGQTKSGPFRLSGHSGAHQIGKRK